MSGTQGHYNDRVFQLKHYYARVAGPRKPWFFWGLRFPEETWGGQEAVSRVRRAATYSAVLQIVNVNLFNNLQGRQPQRHPARCGIRLHCNTVKSCFLTRFLSVPSNLVPRASCPCPSMARSDLRSDLIGPSDSRNRRWPWHFGCGSAALRCPPRAPYN